MMNVSTLTVLLVCVILECAHAASYQWGWERLQLRSKRSTRNEDSVVEDWESVCKEVCGAGYGGLGCDGHCYLESYTPVNPLIQESLGKMCTILCDAKLGLKCGCPSAIDIIDNNTTTVDKKRDRLCSEACRRGFHLKGCTSCSIAADDSTTDENGSKSDSSMYGSDQLTSSNDQGETSEDDGTTEEGEETTTDESTTEEVTTELTTPTTTHPTTTRTTTPATTTPDWSQLCEALCRNGEGGSLCNCDIPPFF